MDQIAPKSISNQLESTVNNFFNKLEVHLRKIETDIQNKITQS